MNPFLRSPSAYKRTPVRAEQPEPNLSDTGVATLRLYDPLDSWGEFWGVSAKEFTAALDSLPAETSEIRLLINSPGGEVWEGLAILNSLRAHPAKVVAIVEGIAASSASFVAAGVDELQMMPNSELFIHKAWGLCVGNADRMTKMSGELAHEDRNIASIYATKAGGSVDDWLDAMAADTWLSADEAVEAGLADRVAAGDNTDALVQARNRFDLSMFNRAGATRPQPKDSSAEAEAPTGKEGPMATLKEEIAKSLGIAEDTTDEDVIAALNEALTERADTDPAPVEQTPETVTQTAARMGLTVVDNSVLEQLRADATAGRQASERQEREDRERVVDDAITRGKITAARREHWLNAIKADPAMVETLNGLPDELAVPMNEIGYSGVDPKETTSVDENDAYKNWSL